MRCEDALELISGRIDGENTETENRLLQDHLDTCKHCRGILQAYLEIDHGVAAPEVEPPVDFTQKVMAAVKKETAGRKKLITVLPLLATAAALFLVVGMGAVRPSVMQQDAAPMTARTMAADAAVYTQTADAEAIAVERQANVVVTHEMLSELEDCGEEMLPDGSVLYALPSVEMAEDLSLAYGLELFGVENAAASYALFVP